MVPGRRARDYELLDALGALTPEPFEGTVWRTTHDERDPLQPSNALGRWSPGDIDVLYTSLEADGARAEVYFHLSRQPVFPSQVIYLLYKLTVKTKETLRFVDVEALSALGVDKDRYSEILPGRTQEIADAALFMGFDGLIVPSARWKCHNLVIFTDKICFDDIEVHKIEEINWEEWRDKTR
jgi:hypothetical protein